MLLRVKDLVTSFRTDAGPLRAADGVSFDVIISTSCGGEMRNCAR